MVSAEFEGFALQVYSGLAPTYRLSKIRNATPRTRPRPQALAATPATCLDDRALIQTFG
jgi:hypothetical protein